MNITHATTEEVLCAFLLLYSSDKTSKYIFDAQH